MVIDDIDIVEKKEHKKLRIVISILEILISAFCIWANLSLLYEYRTNPGVLRIIMVPEWKLLMLSGIGLFGMMNGGLLWLNSEYRISWNLITFTILIALFFLTAFI
jgi:hypothetical protein